MSPALPAVHGGPGVPHQQQRPVHPALGQQGAGAGQGQPQQLDHQRGEDPAEEGEERGVLAVELQTNRREYFTFMEKAEI